MTNETIFITQLGSIIAFIAALFILYRVLVNQKDATIQLLKEKVDFVNEQLAVAKEQTPDKLAKNLSERIHILTEELDRLAEDRDKNKEIIHEKEEKLRIARNELDVLKEQIEEAQEIADEFLCPFCKARMVEHAYSYEDYHGADIDHELIAYECGYTIIDGRDETPCKTKNREKNQNGTINVKTIE
jgi:phenylalanyl-tRNA synthetase alpha subunit